jgi:hypothetical protein
MLKLVCRHKAGSFAQLISPFLGPFEKEETDTCSEWTQLHFELELFLAKLNV